MAKSKEQQELDDYLSLALKKANRSDHQILGNAKQSQKLKGRKNPEHGAKMTELMIKRHIDSPLTADQLNKIAESNRKFRAENPLTQQERYARGNNMRGKKLEEILGDERASAGKKARSEAAKKQDRTGVGAKIAETRRANGSYGTSMLGKEHKDSTKSIMAEKARVRQELKRQLGLGKSDKVPKELLQAEYKKRGWE